ncbi:hypothetical protein ACXR2W_10750 [Leucobacter sp. HY1908]
MRHIDEDTPRQQCGDPQQARQGSKKKLITLAVASGALLAIGGIAAAAFAFVESVRAEQAEQTRVANVLRAHEFNDLARSCEISYSTFEVMDDGESVRFASAGLLGPESAALKDVYCFLDELDATEALISKLEATRALDGNREEVWSDFQASWTYHPNDGLTILIERTDIPDAAEH